MATRTQQQIGSADAGGGEEPPGGPAPRPQGAPEWEESTLAIPPGPPDLERPRADEVTTTMQVDELDALLESAGSGYEGATESLSAHEIDNLLDSARPGAGLRQSAPRRSGGGAWGEASAGTPAAGGGIDFGEAEVGAAFDALEGGSPGDAGAPRHDAMPTAPVPQGAGPATVALHAWGQEEPATVDLRSWMAGTAPASPPVASPAFAAQAAPAPNPASGWPRPQGAAPSAAPGGAPPGPHAHAPPPWAPVADEPSKGASPSRVPRILFFIALAMGAAMLCALTAYLVLHEPPARPASSAAATATTTAAAAPTPQAAEPAMVHGEAEARAALQRLAAGVQTCAREVIKVLPGTSPAVPSTMRLMKNGAYASLPGEYRSPVFSCTQYREDTPQSFQIQWQGQKGGTAGMAVAWLDADGDGQADRALGVRARLIRPREVEIGDVEVLDPVPPVAPSR